MMSLPWGWILLGAIAIAIVASIWRSRAEARSGPAYPPARDAAPSATEWGRQPAGYGAQPYGAPPAQPGMGGNIMGGLATGVAIGAGALMAEEIGRHMLGSHESHNFSSDGAGPVSHPQSDSSLANDAGLGSIDHLGGGDGGAWDDGGSPGDSGGDGGGGDY
jgi:uncharacterized protein